MRAHIHPHFHRAVPTFHIQPQLEQGVGGAGVVAHPGGFAAMDARGDFVACCGRTTRGGLVQPDAYIKVGWAAWPCLYH